MNLAEKPKKPFLFAPIISKQSPPSDCSTTDTAGFWRILRALASVSIAAISHRRHRITSLRPEPFYRLPPSDRLSLVPPVSGGFCEPYFPSVPQRSATVDAGPLLFDPNPFSRLSSPDRSILVPSDSRGFCEPWLPSASQRSATVGTGLLLFAPNPSSDCRPPIAPFWYRRSLEDYASPGFRRHRRDQPPSTLDRSRRTA
jgi:hypothetical protein